MGASDKRQNNQKHQTLHKLGQFPELTLVQRAFPNPFLSAGDITLRSDWTSSSSASRIGGTNGEVASEGEATVLAVTDGFEMGEAFVGVSGGQTVMAAVEEGFGEIGLCTKGMNGGVEVPDLVFVFSIASDIGGETPVPKFFCGVAKVCIVGGTTLEEVEKPGSKRFVWGFCMVNGARKELVGVGWFSGPEMTCDTPDFLAIVLVPLNELGREIEPFSNGDLECGDTVVVADEVSRDPSVVEVKVRVFACLHSDVQAVFGVVNARAHRCPVSLPSNFANLDGGHKSGDDFSQ